MRESSVYIKGVKEEKVTITASIFEVFSLLREKVYEALRLRKDVYIEKGKLYEYVIHGGGSHSWDEKVLLKENPTEEEVETIHALNIIEKVLKRHYKGA